MTHDEFMNNYGEYLEHKWVTSKNKIKAEAQKNAEKLYNAEYYRKNKYRILEQQRARRSGARSGSLLTFEEKLNNAINQGRQQNTLNKRSPFDTAASEAQANAAANRRNTVIQNRTLSKRSSFDTAASEAQAQARNPRRQQNTLNKRSSFDTAASEAQAQAARNNAAYNKSLTSKIAKNLSKASKASKKITDTILDDVDTAKQKAIDIYNDMSPKINKAKKSVQIILNKYFG